MKSITQGRSKLLKPTLLEAGYISSPSPAWEIQDLASQKTNITHKTDTTEQKAALSTSLFSILTSWKNMQTKNTFHLARLQV